MKPILILKTGSSFSELAHACGDFEDRIIAASGEAPGLFTVSNGLEEPLPPLTQLSGIIVTGSHRMVTEGGEAVELWSQLLRAALAAGLPLLGLCYGHQLLGHALGGRVGDHPGGLELGQVEIEMEEAAAEDPLFCVLPRRLAAYATHRQTVLELPPGARAYGRNSFEPYHAVRFGAAAWGVQFHPEFDQQYMRAYIRYQRPRLQSDAEMESLLQGVTALPQAGSLLERFCQLASS